MDRGAATRSQDKQEAEGLRAGAPSVSRRLGWRAGDLGGWLRDALESELAERTGFQWLAVSFAVGALTYFALPREPLLSALTIASAAPLLVAALGYRRGTPWRIAAVLALALAGATAGKVRVESLVGPHMDREITAEIEGRVVSHEDRVERRPRILLDRLRSRSIPAGAIPDRIRLTVSEKHGLPPLGARVSLLARLMPVAGPAVPGGYDPRRAAFFQGIGASGFALGGWKELGDPPHSFDLVISRLRAAIVGRIMAAQPGEAGAVAAALLVGERSALSAETNESLRISGLAHILSISGLHMMLIAGTAFLFVRAGLALSPRLALTRPIRKWAALAALGVVTIYLALSGGGAATVRAYVMAAIMFLAILVDRPAISMRNLAVAAFVVLLLEPESVTEPGFQMSFAAVAALIAGWEAWQDRRRLRLADDSALPGLGILSALRRAFLGVALTSLLAGLATAPFAAYHFERVATYSLLGNLLTAPLVSLIIMPFGLLTLAVLPLGLEALPLMVMAWGIDGLLWLSSWVAGLPGAEASAPPMSPASLLLITAGMLWLCLWRTRWRLFGLPAIAAGILLVPVLVNPPDLLVAPEGKVVAVRDPTGELRVSGGRAGSYTVEQLFDEEPGPAPPAESLRRGIACDELACLLEGAGGTRVSHVLSAEALVEDCQRAQIVVTALAAPSDCRASLVIDAGRLRAFGAHAVRFGKGKGGFAVTTELSAYPRPWQAPGPGRPGLNTSATSP